MIPFNGLVIELDHPGRFDSKELCSGPGGRLLNYALLQAKSNRFGCHIRTLETKGPYPQGTKVVLLCGEKGLVKIDKPVSRGTLNMFRGSPFEQNGIVFIPTYHTQDASDRQDYETKLNRQPEDSSTETLDESRSSDEEDETDVKDYGRTLRTNYGFWFQRDIFKAVDVCRNGLRVNVASYRLYLPIASYLEWMAALPAGSSLYLDIETNVETQQITAIGLATSPAEIYVLPIYNYRGQRNYDKLAIAEFFLQLSKLFRICNVVIHNSLFDLFILAWRYHVLPPPQDQIYDTMIAHHRLFVGVEKSLGHCGSLYTHQVYHKNVSLSPTSGEQEREFLLYNAKDVELMALIHEKQLVLAKELAAEPSLKLGNNLVRPLLLKMLQGIPINKDLWCKRIDELDWRTEWFEQNVLGKLVGHSLNPRSPKQVAEYLYEELGLEKPKSEHDSITGKYQLYKLLLQHNIPALKVILACRRWSKENGTLHFKLWREHYVTCAYKPAGTKSFRLSSSKLLGYKNRKDAGWGTNLQNWKKDVRKLIVPPPGMIFIQVDQAGAEALIVAYITSASCKLRQLFANKVKVHTYVAAHLFANVYEEEFGKLAYAKLLSADISELPKSSDWKALSKKIKDSDNNPPATRYYYLAKQTCHSANYDIKTQTFIMNVLEKSEGQIVIPYKEGDRFLAVYHDLFPQIRSEFHAWVKTCVLREHVIRNMFGHPRYCYTPSDLIRDQDLKDWYSWVPQSTVGCITNIADEQMQRKLDTGELSGFVICQNNHDSLLIATTPDRKQGVARIVQEHMNIEMTNHRGEKFRMASEANWGHNWKDTKEEL